MTEPVVFLKSPTSVCAPHDDVVSRFDAGTLVWGESELAIVIGHRLSCATIDEATKGIFGWTLANDVTAENIDGRDHHLARSKAADSFCPIGPYIDTTYSPDGRQIQGFHNGKLVRDGSTADFFWDHLTLIRRLSCWITLEPWDVILTGAPPLVGPLTYLGNGDTFVVRAEGFESDLVNSFRQTPPDSLTNAVADRPGLSDGDTAWAQKRRVQGFV
jgi:2-keto-4-pentenoate hydratase/2-oxohepta-3-ene-1,7-dioic acid hydratase in catechol pathway